MCVCWVWHPAFCWPCAGSKVCRLGGVTGLYEKAAEQGGTVLHTVAGVGQEGVALGLGAAAMDLVLRLQNGFALLGFA